MTISDLILNLERLKNEHGDIEVGSFDSEWGNYQGLTRVGTKETDYKNNCIGCDDESLGKYFVTLF